MPVPDWLEVASAVANVAGGAATALAAGYGLHEFRQWKSRKQSEDRGAAAARILATIEPFCNAVSNWISAVSILVDEARRERPAEAMQTLDRSTRVWNQVEARQKDLAAAGFAAQAYLSDEDLAPAVVLQDVYTRAGWELPIAMMRLGDKPDVSVETVCEELVVAVRAHKAPLEEARAAGREIFRRIAQHEKPPPRRAAAERRR
jgi:hypothetical protein